MILSLMKIHIGCMSVCVQVCLTALQQLISTGNLADFYISLSLLLLLFI